MARVGRTLQARGLLHGAARVLVACSGGPDSQALLHALVTLRDRHGCQILAAGVDHGLRAEAGAELALAAALARSLEVSFVTLTVRVPAGASLQGQARAARYEALLAHARAQGAARIAVGHTRDDQAETVLARLLRGSGIEGLGAIAPHRADGVVRPLIDASRAQVHAHVANHALPVARDPSNLDPRHLRVRVRQDLLPRLAAENARIAEQLAALADDARATAGLLAERVAGVIAEAGPQVVRLRSEPPLVRRLALKALVEREVGKRLARTHLEALDRMLSHGGTVRVPGDVVVSIAKSGALSLTPVTKRGRGIARPTDERR